MAFMEGHRCVTDEALRGMRVVVMGLGRFGGGIGVTKFLVRRRANVLVTDQAPAGTLKKSVESLAGIPVEYHLGEHRESDLDGADLVVISPAINRAQSKFFEAAMARSIGWTTEMNLFLARCAAPIVGVTGSVGKSTTCSMLHTILEHAIRERRVPFRQAHLGGNIGRSMLDLVDQMGRDDIVVLELSSFQLEALGPIASSCPVSGITNISPHHLDRHDGFDAYVDAKLNLVRAQRRGDCVVLGSIDELVASRVHETAASLGVIVEIAREEAAAFDLVVPGRHNQCNALMALALARRLGADDAVSREALTTFRGLPHRLEFVREIDGVRWYNDSKATSPASVATAVASFSGPIVLLCGGKDTGSEAGAMLDVVRRQVRAVICFGEVGPRLAALVATRVAASSGEAFRIPNLPDAIQAAHRISRSGDVVLLSPGFPSYDEFVNYEDRGESYARMVCSIVGDRPETVNAAAPN